MRLASALVAVAVVAGPRAADARPWTLADLGAALTDIDTIEVASTGAVLFDDATTDLAHDTNRVSWLILDPATGAIRELPAPLSIAKLRWAPDGRRLAALAPDQDGTPQLSWIDARTFAVTPLTHGAHGSSISNFAISPSGKQIAAIETQPAPASAAPPSFWYGDNTDVLGGAPPPMRQLVIIDAATGAERRAVADSFSYGGPVTDHDPAWSADGRRVAVVRQPTSLYGDYQNAQVVAVDVATGAVRALEPSKTFALPDTAAPAFSAGGHLATVHTWDDRFDSREDLFIDHRNVSSAFDHDFWSCSLTHIAWAGEDLLATAMDGVDLRLYRFARNGAAPVALTPSGGSVDAFAPGPGGAIYVAFSTATQPAELYRIAADGSLQPLTQRHGLPAELAIAPSTIVTWPDGHGHTLFGQLAEAASHKPPLLTELHGGPQCADTSAFDPFAQYFATNGYSYFRPSPRGSDGYGDWSYKAIVNDWGPGPMADVMAGIDAMLATHVLDRDRLFLYGTSYGGYLTTWMVTHSDRFHAAVAAIPVTDLVLDYTLSQSPNITRRFFGARPVADNQAVLVAQSPMTAARALHTPLLLIAGLKDAQAPYPQTIELFKTLRELGKDVALLAYPAAGHGPDTPRGALDWTAHVAGWFAARGGLAIPDAQRPPAAP